MSAPQVSALIALLLVLAPLAEAGDETQIISKGAEARVWSPWPGSVHKGWAPIFVEIRNELAEEREVEILAECGDWGNERRVHTRVRLGAEENAALELLVPLGAVFTNSYYVRISCDEASAYFGDAVGANSTNPNFHPVLFLSEFEPEAGAVERWSETVSTTTVEGASPRMVFGAGASSAAAPAKPNDVDLAHARFAGMPRHHAGYSSLDLVVLEPDGGMPSEAQLAPLTAWVRTGGDLLVMGKRARASALAVPELAAWMEPRFETGTEAEGKAYRCGLGRLFVGEVAGDLDSGYVDWVRQILAGNGGLVPKNGSWRGDALTPSIPGLARLPYRSFAALLMLFALVIGPVNFLAVRKRRNPVLLLLTIPAIALVTTVALLAYGIFFQGVDVKSASYSVAVLDQREHRSACVESRQFFAGIAPAAGLELGPGTIVHLWPHDGRINSWNRRRLEVELAGGTLLAGDFLPSRKATKQVLAVERAERARLDVHADGRSVKVDNNLGVAVEALVVRDAEGEFHLLEGSLAPGASAELRKPDSMHALITAQNGIQLPLALTSQQPPALETVPVGCYLARLERGPFRDDCGIEMNELDGAHVVLGVLPLEPEAWR